MTPLASGRPLLMLVTESHADLVERVFEAVTGGVDFVCLRARDLDPEAAARLGSAIRDIVIAPCRLVINGAPELAVGCKADGVHLPEAASASDFERAGRHGLVIGASVHSLRAAQRAMRLGASYLLAGSIYETRSHPGRAPAGLGFLRDVCNISRVPVLAIGGISPERTPDCLDAGASGVAAISGILGAPSVLEAARSYRGALDEHATSRNARKNLMSTVGVTINGEPREIEQGSTISVFLASIAINEKTVVVEYNGNILPRAEYAAQVIGPGDILEIVQMMAGG
ncbi:MAG: sulfur carrier protein ThiS [Capsulimonadaceae bacterium]|nr:sulfur carrier protein ThiS [Capsulimonadaceae bacterium]